MGTSTAILPAPIAPPQNFPRTLLPWKNRLAPWPSIIPDDRPLPIVLVKAKDLPEPYALMEMVENWDGSNDR